jgi:hypothetical protein
MSEDDAVDLRRHRIGARSGLRMLLPSKSHVGDDHAVIGFGASKVAGTRKVEVYADHRGSAKSCEDATLLGRFPCHGPADGGTQLRRLGTVFGQTTRQ